MAYLHLDVDNDFEGTYRRITSRPRWVGADGFDRAWKVSQHVFREFFEFHKVASSAAEARRLDKARSSLALSQLKLARGELRVAALNHVVEVAGGDRSVVRNLESNDESFDIEDVDKILRDEWPYMVGLGSLSLNHLLALSETTPILFDPLTAPRIVGDEVIENLRLPFPVVTCDFLNQRGFGLPVRVFKGTDIESCVELVAATLCEHEDFIDVWPVVRIKSDDGKRHECMLYGVVRIGGDRPMPPPDDPKMDLRIVRLPQEMAPDLRMEACVPGDSDDEELTKIQAQMWVQFPAFAALHALSVLDAVNVSLEDTKLPRPTRRRAEREGREPALEVMIRTSRKSTTDRLVSAGTAGTVDWQHRWKVRGHWKHFTKGPIFNANPRKRVVDQEGREFVKVWCPPFVKGPDDKPLVLKTRRAEMV